MGIVDVSLGDIGTLAKNLREAWTGEAITDPNKAMEFELQLRELEQAAITAQTEVNKVEAQHPNVFVAGWRPAIGWVAALSLALMYIPKAIMMTYMWSLQCMVAIDAGTNEIPAFPDLGAMDIIGLVVSMLGVAGMRSFDKWMGTDTKRISDG